MSPDAGSTSAMYAPSHNGGAGHTPVTNGGTTGDTNGKHFTPFKPGEGLRALVDNTLVTVD